MSSAQDEGLVLAAIFAGAGDVPAIRAATGLGAAETRAAIGRARFKGKIAFDRIALSASVAATLAEQAEAKKDSAAEPEVPLEPHGAAGEGSGDEPERGGGGGVSIPPSPLSEQMGAPVAVEPHPVVDGGAPGADDGAAASCATAAAAPDLPDGDALRAEIRGYCARTGTSESRFGLAAAKSTAFVKNLEHIRQPRRATIKRVRNFIAANPDGVSETRRALRGMAAPSTDLGTRLLGEIEAWCGRTGTTEKQLGAALFRHWGYVPLLRKRGTVTEKTAATVRQFMADHPDGIAKPGAATAPAAAPQRSNPDAVATAAAKRAIAAPAPAATSVADQVKQEASDAGTRRQLARSTGTVTAAAALPAPAGETDRLPGRLFDPPKEPRRRIALPPDLTLVESVQSLLAETPEDLIRAVSRAHPKAWRRLIELGRATGQRPGQAFYAALEAGLDHLEGAAS